VYVTQYRINHEEEMKRLSSGVAFQQCIPCFTCGTVAKHDRSVAWIWYFFASKLLLFAVHLGTIFFGVIKVGVGMYPRSRAF